MSRMPNVITDEKRIEELLTRGVDKVYPTSEAMKRELMSGRRLRLYTGWDPTSADVHLGHTVWMRKLRQFQDLGHEVIVLMGTFTATLGDPTGKLNARKMMTLEETKANAKTFRKQAGKILNFRGENPVKMQYNHTWFSRMTLADAVGLASHFTVQQMLERDMFEKRMANDQPIFCNEFMYPLMQGYDSVVLDVDLEVGGTDQTFNMLAGRTLMKSMKNKEKFVLTVPLLTDASGNKIGKSEGNVIRIDGKPEELYGQVMSLGDGAIIPCFELCTDLSSEDIAAIKKGLHGGGNPRDAKAKLAWELVRAYHSKAKANAAAKHFDSLFREHETPADVPTYQISAATNIVDVLVGSKLAATRSEARRLIDGGGVKVDGVAIAGYDVQLYPSKPGVLVQKGKRHFVRVIA